MSRIRPFPGPVFAPRKMDSPPPPRTDKSITRISGSGLRGKISLFAEFLGWIALLPSFFSPGINTLAQLIGRKIGALSEKSSERRFDR